MDKEAKPGGPTQGDAPSSVEAGRAGYARSPVRDQPGRGKQQRPKEGAAGIEETAERGASELRDTVERKKEELKQTATRRTDEMKSRFGDRVETVVRAIRRAGEELRNEGEPRIAELTDEAATQVERLRSYVDGRSTNEMFADVRRNARMHPAYFIGSTFALGLLLGRFLKANPEPSESRSYGGEDAWDEAVAGGVGL
jgi:gas vesicle protein